MAQQDASMRAFRSIAMKAELLEADVEHELALKWRDEKCEKSLHRLINAYMRLAISMAGKFRKYGLPMTDLTQEATVGLMKAAEKFDPDRGVRFSTYAVWWIKASIQDYVMRNWSLVRMGSTSAQKSLFFNLRRVRARIENDTRSIGAEIDTIALHEQIAKEIGVSQRDVRVMDARMSGSDASLNTTQTSDEEGREWIETLVDSAEPTEERVAEARDQETMRVWLVKAMNSLNERERMIVVERKLADEPRTLESLGDELGLSKERVRQLESAALTKMKKHLQTEVGTSVKEMIFA